MVEVEKALRDSIELYKRHPVFVLPHFIESLLTIGVIISAAITVLLAIGVHITDIMVEDPEQLINQITGVGMGLIGIIIVSFLFGLFVISLIKAGALAGVVQMAKEGFEGKGVSLGTAFKGAKKSTVDIFLFWVSLSLILIALVSLAFIPALLLTLLGVSEMIAAGITILMMLVSLLVVVIFLILLMFTPQIIVVEERGVFESMKRSFDFVKANVGAVAIYVAVVLVVNFLIFGFFGILSVFTDLFYRGSDLIGAFVELFLLFIRAGLGLIIAPFFEMVKTRMITKETELLE